LSRPAKNRPEPTFLPTRQGGGKSRDHGLRGDFAEALSIALWRIETGGEVDDIVLGKRGEGDD
jgi:hypothetical protein